MTKSELIDAVNAAAAEKGIDLTKKDTRALIEILFETVADSIADEERFSFPDFGTFNIRHRKAREGRNPRTGEPIQIPASNTVSFKPAPKFKEDIN